MKLNIPTLRSTVLLATVLSLIFVGTVLAATITVDGDPTDWPGNPSCTPGNSGCALEQTDTDESSSTTMPAEYDIREVWATNDTSDAFFRLDTEATTSFSSGEFVRICLDVPNQSPGQTTVGGCSGFATDRVVVLQDRGSGVRSFAYDCNSVDCNNLFSTTTGTGTATRSGTVTEARISLSALGLGSPDDGDVIDAIVFFDNSDNPPDDNVPDSGSFGWQIGTGSPTTITLNGASAESDAGTQFTPTFALLGLVGLGGVGLALMRRRKQQ